MSRSNTLGRRAERGRLDKLVDTEGEGAEPIVLGENDEPGPRLAQTLAEQAERAQTRRRRIIGVAILLAGVVVAAAAAAGVASKHGSHDDVATKGSSTTTTVATVTSGCQNRPSR